MNYYYQKLLELNADGIDFISLGDLYTFPMGKKNINNKI